MKTIYNKIRIHFDILIAFVAALLEFHFGTAENAYLWFLGMFAVFVIYGLIAASFQDALNPTQLENLRN